MSKGYAQEWGIDYKETFAPVSRYKTLRIIMCLSVTPARCVDQIDFKTAFLNAPVEEDIYVANPEKMHAHSSYVLKLNKALYGIKQAPRAWHQLIDAYLRQLGFTVMHKDTCRYVMKGSVSGELIMMGLFVDDMVISYHAHDKQRCYTSRSS